MLAIPLKGYYSIFEIVDSQVSEGAGITVIFVSVRITDKKIGLIALSDTTASISVG